MIRRTQTVYVSVDAFFSLRGKVLHHFDAFLEALDEAQIPCVWMTGWTRAQIDEPRRRLGQNAPYIGENGSGVFLPEDYFHLKSGKTLRLGRYTCIPVAQPQPAAAEALEELAADLDIAVVPLGKLSPRELSQNTGLPAREAELIRTRDFDEVFFFAGATDEEIGKFGEEARARGMALRTAGAFWSLSCGGDLGKCVRELGGLYDRAVRSHAQRYALRIAGTKDEKADGWPAAAFDRTLVLTERNDPHEGLAGIVVGEDEDRAGEDQEGKNGEPHGHVEKSRRADCFHLGSPTLWEEVLAALHASAGTHRG